MTDWKLPWDGGCRCGRMRFRVDAPPLVTSACHCTGCQSMTSNAFSLSVAIPTAGFHITRGEPVIGGLHGPSQHFFCPWCMSWMFTKPEGVDFFVNLRATMLDDPSWYVPFIETWTSERLPWATTPAPHSYEALPTMEEFPGLIAVYADWAAGPG